MVPPSVEVVGVGVVEVDVGAGVGMVVFVRGCGSSGPKGLIGAVLEMVVQVVPPNIDVLGVGVSCNDSRLSDGRGSTCRVKW